MDRNDIPGEPGPEPDTTDAATPDDTHAPLDPEDAPDMIEEHGESVDGLDV